MLSDNEGENAARRDAGNGAAGSSDLTLTARMDLMLQSMQQMWEEMKAGQEKTALKQARNAKHDPFLFRRKGNENQFRFCENVEEQLQSASSSISRAEKEGKEALSRAKIAVEQGMELLSRRKKLIKLADHSEAGWALVEEYVKNDLAEDFGDEMRIEKAECAAERKITKRKRELDAAMKRTVARHNERTEPLVPDGKRLLVPFAGSAPGACHQCGEFGHWPKARMP